MWTQVKDIIFFYGFHILKILQLDVYVGAGLVWACCMYFIISAYD